MFTLVLILTKLFGDFEAKKSLKGFKETFEMSLITISFDISYLLIGGVFYMFIMSLL